MNKTEVLQEPMTCITMSKPLKIGFVTSNDIPEVGAPAFSLVNRKISATSGDNLMHLRHKPAS